MVSVLTSMYVYTPHSNREPTFTEQQYKGIVFSIMDSNESPADCVAKGIDHLVKIGCLNKIGKCLRLRDAPLDSPLSCA